MHSCSKEFRWKFSNPKMSKIPMKLELSFPGLVHLLIWLTNQAKVLKYKKISWNYEWMSEKFSLSSRNFQNGNLRLGFVELWSFCCHSDFTWIQILVNSNIQKNVIFGNFRGFSQFQQVSSPKFIKIQSLESLNLPKMTFLDHTNWSKLDFT